MKGGEDEIKIDTRAISVSLPRTNPDKSLFEAILPSWFGSWRLPNHIHHYPSPALFKDTIFLDAGAILVAELPLRPNILGFLFNPFVIIVAEESWQEI